MFQISSSSSPIITNRRRSIDQPITDQGINRISVSLVPSLPLLPYQPKPTPPQNASSFWQGTIHMPGRYRFRADFLPISDRSELVKRDLPRLLHISGRISPSVVYEYLTKIRARNCKDVIVFRISEPWITNENWKDWNGVYENMASRNQMVVVDIGQMPRVKDFYLLALSPDEMPNKALLPFGNGPGKTVDVFRKCSLL